MVSPFVEYRTAMGLNLWLVATKQIVFVPSYTDADGPCAKGVLQRDTSKEPILQIASKNVQLRLHEVFESYVFSSSHEDVVQILA